MANFDFYGEYHTHTTFSHGKGSVRDNVLVAREKGLREIAITDHGLRHIVVGLRPRKLPRLRAEVEALNREFPDINVIMGVEANINGLLGSIDVKEKQRELFDLIIGGYHRAVFTARPSEYFTYHGSAIYERLTGKSTAKMIARSTDAFIKVIESFPLAVLTHINYGLSVDVKAVCECCASYGTLLELNGKRINMTDDEFEAALKTDVRFIVNSDAHTPDRVGDFSLGEGYVLRYGIEDRIENIGKRPNFRK